MSSQHKNKKESNNKIKKKPSKIFDNDDISKDNIKIYLDTNDLSNDNKNSKNINKNNEENNDIKAKKKKVKFNRKIDVINVECWKKYNSENTVEPNVNNSKDTTKCTCEIF